MSLWIFLVAAVLLSVERFCYVWAWRAPKSFRAFCHRPGVVGLGDPVSVLQKLFYGFKGIQFAVFFGWCFLQGTGFLSPLMSGDRVALAVGAAAVVVGVFYGAKFGYVVPWCRAFPFSLLTHPQYVGTLLSIWGFFLALRFPHDDWYLLPTLQTVYYVVGAYFEQEVSSKTVPNPQMDAEETYSWVNTRQVEERSGPDSEDASSPSLCD
jgi:methylene-fatty-acyl-phospholipid synthase